jgi:hypothetical protein
MQRTITILHPGDTKIQVIKAVRQHSEKAPGGPLMDLKAAKELVDASEKAPQPFTVLAHRALDAIAALKEAGARVSLDPEETFTREQVLALLADAVHFARSSSARPSAIISEVIA